MRPWQIWEHLLGAFVLLASVSGPTALLVPGLIEMTGLGPGHYLYCAAMASLWPIVGVAIYRAHRRPPLRSVA